MEREKETRRLLEQNIEPCQIQSSVSNIPAVGEVKGALTSDDRGRVGHVISC